MSDDEEVKDPREEAISAMCGFIPRNRSTEIVDNIIEAVKADLFDNAEIEHGDRIIFPIPAIGDGPERDDGR